MNSRFRMSIHFTHTQLSKGPCGSNIGPYVMLSYSKKYDNDP